jgi:hypothetical protein
MAAEVFPAAVGAAQSRIAAATTMPEEHRS